MMQEMDSQSLVGPLIRFLERREGLLRIHGLKGSSPAYLLSRIASRARGPVVLLTADEEKADRLYLVVSRFCDIDLHPQAVGLAGTAYGQRGKLLDDA
jgi:hypothetical protein